MTQENLVLVLGWFACIGVISLIYGLIKSARHGGTVATISVPALFVSLGFFCISTPKINRLVLDWGKKTLDVSSLERKIDEKQQILARLEDQESKARVAAATSGRDTDLRALVSKATDNPNGLYHNDGWVALSPRKAEGLLNGAIGSGETGVVMFKSEDGSVTRRGVFFDSKTGQPKELNLTHDQQEKINNAIKVEK